MNETALPEPGLYPDMPAEEYFGLPILSNSELKWFEASPRKYRYKKAFPKPPTPAMVIGTATHCKLLDPGDNFEREFIVAPKTRLNTNAGKKIFDEWLVSECMVMEEDADEVRVCYQDWKNPQKETSIEEYQWLINKLHGRQILRPDDIVKIDGMIEAIFEDEIAVQVLSTLELTEVSAIWEFNGKPFKCRIDGISTEMKWAADLKCVSDANPDGGFSRKVWNMKYHRQGGLYSKALVELEPDMDIDQFLFIAVEQEQPHDLAVYACNREMLMAGLVNADRLVTEMQECERTGVWPGYADKIVDLNLPAFGWKKVMEELSEIGA